MKIKNLERFILIFSLVLCFVCSYIFGIVTVKYIPSLINLTDFQSLFTLILTFTYFLVFIIFKEKQTDIILDPKIKKVGQLYSQGHSFRDIQKELGLKNLNDVKIYLTKFCEKNV